MEDLGAEIRKELKDYFKTYAIAYCKEAQKELTKTAHSAMRKFYEEYDPDYYKRTFNLYDPRERNDTKKNGAVIPYFKDNGGHVYGGVRIHSINMDWYNSKGRGTDPYEVMDFAVHGWHGHPLRGIYKTPTILEIMDKKFNDESFLKKLDEKAADAVRKQKNTYKYIIDFLKF